MYTEKQYADLINEKSQLSNTYKLHVYKLARFLVSFLASNEEVVDVIGVKFGGYPAFLLLTNKHLGCLSFSKSSQEVQKCFVFSQNNVERVVTSENGLRIYHNKTEFIVRFDDDKLTSKFVNESLSSFAIVEKGELLPQSQKQTLNQVQETEPEIKCPKCKSTQLTANKKGFGLGKAATGAVLLGPVGLLGGFIGSNKTVITCLRCGHSWKPGKA